MQKMFKIITEGGTELEMPENTEVVMEINGKEYTFSIFSEDFMPMTVDIEDNEE